MSDLISRQNAIDVLEILADKMSDAGQTVMEQAVSVLKYLQSAEPERKKGKWVFEDGKPVNRTLKMGEIAVCNQCGKKAPGYPFWECNLELTNFCPNCGADMRGD